MAGHASGRPPARAGSFANGMEYVTWGTGPRTCLFVPGGPGSDVPRGTMLRMYRRLLAPLVDAGFAVWVVTRRRHMPSGHTVADMADDYAQAVADELGGTVDLVVGESYGGMIAQYLAAFHPERFRHLAIVAAACEVDDWGKDVDSRMALAVAARDSAGAGTVMLEYALPGRRLRWVRRLLGPVMGRLLLGDSRIPAEDVLTEARAEEAFDARAVLPRIEVPVLLLCGTRDRFFSRELVEETAALIPDCTLVRYGGHGHLRTCSSGRVARDVLAFVDRAPTPTPP